MSTLFSQMTPNEITAIKMKMPIARNFEHHKGNLRTLLNNPTSSDSKVSALGPKASHDLTVQDIRDFFKS